MVTEPINLPIYYMIKEPSLRCFFRRLALGAFFALLAIAAAAQLTPLSLKEIPALVKDNLPQLSAYRLKAQATAQEIALQKNTLTPDLTVAYQADYATYNNLTGMSYPGLIMPVTGPPTNANIFTPVPGSALVGLLKWNPITFGQRQAAIDKAVSDYALARSDYDQQLFREQYTAVYDYLDLLYMQKYLAALRANISRNQVALDASYVLTKTGLRAGIDSVQIQGAVAQTEIELFKAQKQYKAQQLELKRLTGNGQPGDSLLLVDTLLNAQLPMLPDTSGALTGHPFYQFYESKVLVSQRQLNALDKAWRPRLDLWATAYGRGSGVLTDGTIKSANGLALSRINYGAGFQISFPILQYREINIQKKQQQFLVLSDQANLAQAALDLTVQQQTAYSNFTQSLLIARKVPVQLKAAQDAYRGMRISYEKGLTDYTRLVQTEYDLFSAEVNQAGIYVQAWRSLLDLAVAKGNLSLFFDQIK